MIEPPGEPSTVPPCPLVPIATGIEGYGVCRCGCGRHELNHVLHLTKGLHWECFRDDVMGKLREAEIMHRNIVTKAVVPRKATKRKSGAKRTGRTETTRLTAQARHAAWRRLAQLQPELFAVLYADERHRRGLTIVPRRTPQGEFAATVATNTSPADYSADVEPGEMDAHEGDQAGQRSG